MKKSCNSILCCKGNALTTRSGFNGQTTLFFCFMLLIGLAFTGCKKETMQAPAEEVQKTSSRTPAGGNAQGVIGEENVLNEYAGLPSKTAWELQQARAATARYRNIKNAIKDGYADIGVVVPNMGFHYMKSSLVDATFDVRSPEILVYNKNENGNIQLVAVEYAVPLTLSTKAPEGFTGTQDKWDENTGFGLWLLHAWVWHYNPDGVFNSTNPLVHLH